MPGRTTDDDTPRQDEVYRCLTHYRRRRILAILADRDSPLEESELANRITAAESTDDDRQTDTDPLRVDLRHRHLPVLSDAGLVDWDRERGTVAAASHPSLRDEDVLTHLDRLDDSWDPFVSALAHRYRRLVLSTASRRREPVAVDALVDAIVERERDRGADVCADEVRVSLHHTHLPALQDADLVAYDGDDRTVTFRGHPSIEDEWFAAEIDDPASAGPALARVPL